MILTFFAIGVILGAIFLFLGYTQYSFPMMYLGMFIFLLLGLFLMSDGLDIETGSHLVPDGSGGQIVSAVYTTYTTANNFVVNIVANTFFYIPFVGVLLSTLFALRGWD